MAPPSIFLMADQFKWMELTLGHDRGIKKAYDEVTMEDMIAFLKKEFGE